MTDDQTRSYQTPGPADPPAEPAADTTPATDPAPPADATLATDAAPPAETVSAAPATGTPATDGMPPAPSPAIESPTASATLPPQPAATEIAGAGVGTAAAGSSRTALRWGLGLGLAGLVLVLTAGAVFLLGGTNAPEALKYVPADSALVMEARFDLPGDQMQKLGNLLAHFPGFADQSTLTAKIDEALGRFIDAASGGDSNYATDIKPWLNGPVFLSGDATTLAAAESAPAERFLLSATTNNAVTCSTTFDDDAVAHETYRGLDLVTANDGAIACVVDGRIGLIGDTASVKKALDTKGSGSGMDKSGAYAAARKALTGDQLATIYIAGAALRDAMPLPAPTLAIPGLEGFAGQIPEWLILGVRAEDDALVVDGIAAPVPAASGGASLLPAPPAHPSVVAPQVPADTLVYFEDQGAGVSLQNLFTQLRAVPDLEAPLQMLDGVGGPAGLVGWIDDAAVAVSATNPTPDNPNPKVSVYLVAKDDATAAEKLATVKTFIALAGLSGEGIAVATETLSGVEVTTVTISDLGAIVPPGSVPGVDTGTLDTPVSFSIAGRGRIIYLTVGDGAMADMLAVQAGSSLADDAAFKLAGQRGLPNSRTTLYVAVGATVDLVQGFLPPEIAAQWATEFAPYVDPLEALGFSVSMDPSATRSRFVLTVNQP